MLYSLSAHIDELRILFSDRPLDILAINETKLDHTISGDEIHISGYESIRSDRSTNGWVQNEEQRPKNEDPEDPFKIVLKSLENRSHMIVA